MMKHTPKQEKRFAALATKMGIDVVDAESICRCASGIWDYIGFDCLEANGGKDMRRSEVIEVVMDASHMTTGDSRKRLTAPALALLQSYQHSDDIAALLKEFEFTHALYGM
jgi:hypothetical protein